jgi:TRAP-type uncharacterized transport system fused permease subunit
VVPFVFVFGPELLWIGPLWRTAITFGTAAVALVFLAAAIERYSKWCDAWWTRLLLAAGALCMITPIMWLTAVGVAIAASALALNRLQRRLATA